LDDLITLRGEKLLTMVKGEIEKEFKETIEDLLNSGYYRPSGEFSVFRFKIEELKNYPQWIDSITKKIVSKFIEYLE
jgi:pimeloyl-CoA synthetase